MAVASHIIEIKNGTKKFGNFVALHDINLSIREGEILTLLGPSGCGKSTLLRALAGFEDLSSGSLLIGGSDMRGIPPERRPVNMVFQRYALFPHLDVFQNVAFGLQVKGIPGAEVHERVNQVLDIVQLASMSDRYIDQISGGQSQRVALARALVNEPKVLLLDEPLAALDLKIRQHMLAEMKRIHAKTGATFVYVTHDQDEALMLSDHIVLMNKGQIVQIGTPREMYDHPRSLFAAKFLGETNIFKAKVVETGSDGIVAQTTTGDVFRSETNGDLAAGDDVHVSIRPESMSFVPDAQRTQSLQAIVRNIIFIGSRSFFELALPDGEVFEVQIQSATHTQLPEVGEQTAVHWAAQNVVILRQE